ncbi:hypothetical protein [Erythrobacter sp. F6033]|uniref:hypothetical protein n=1 Tax=Erythrobacter sp. F6033 TaxID=2926401 RepID=UPI001FF4D2C9|nr:hypothetical protein [Erythrobacter sp. F6033]MCK0129050.1 hypothetical protein [Erythrobacter sp. F6033]
MTEASSNEIPLKRKMVIPLISGAVAGVVSAAAVMTFMDANFDDTLSASRMIAAVVGGLYMMIAIGVGVGAASPALGEKYLNTEDADEIREMRAVLLYSAIAMTLWGAALVLLALAAPAGPVPAQVALIIATAMMAIGAWLGWKSHKASDELYSRVNIEATAVAYFATIVIGGGWMMLAHLELADAMAPLDWLTMFYVTGLAATFIVTGRRGMLKVA